MRVFSLYVSILNIYRNYCTTENICASHFYVAIFLGEYICCYQVPVYINISNIVDYYSNETRLTPTGCSFVGKGGTWGKTFTPLYDASSLLAPENCVGTSAFLWKIECHLIYAVVAVPFAPACLYVAVASKIFVPGMYDRTRRVFVVA